MKIIRQGKRKVEIVFKVTCNECDSELEYEESDVQIDTSNITYIICPSCGERINH